MRKVDKSSRFAICKSHQEILDARTAGKIALLLTMEGVEPFGTNLDLLRVFFELGVRVIGLTHARPECRRQWRDLRPQRFSGGWPDRFWQ